MRNSDDNFMTAKFFFIRVSGELCFCEFSRSKIRLKLKPRCFGT